MYFCKPDYFPSFVFTISNLTVDNLLFFSNQDFFTCVHAHLLLVFRCTCELEDFVFIPYYEGKLLSYTGFFQKIDDIFHSICHMSN